MALKEKKVRQYLWHRPRKARKYLWKIRKARYGRGFGIHSPFAFSLITNVLREKSLYYDYTRIEKLRDALLNDPSLLLNSETQKKIQKSLTSERHGRFLFRLVNFFHPESLLEIGTGLGVDTLYMASPHLNCHCFTLEEDPLLQDLSESLFSAQTLSNIELVKGAWKESLEQVLTKIEKLDFVCLNANQYQPLHVLYTMCRTKMHEQSIFVIRNIRASRDLYEVWEELKKEEKVISVVDMYSMGILLYNPTLTNKHYSLYY